MATNLMRFSPFNNIARFEPFKEFEDMFRELQLSPAMQAFESAHNMKMDVSETEKAYTVTAEVPGMKKEDIKIDIEGNRVSISAEKSELKEQKDGETIVRSERFSGRLYRGFSLGDEIDAEHAVAKYQDGILELSLPKKKRNGAKPLTIS
ncbi:Hsp20/alpha crystallin family protein [Herminiimonas fonticola]|uniref:Heat shock protein Hsp20 n=1 Tax=Herminiimonas fonticola TaxID=303380 RepID=A0A4R6G109_9BURK|nr:Hsp20/alpha crystallin family protein [Herminiimonas fonticola]RBA23625.1 Molecular chaperone (small heat shock protein) [Herminiimonas fonticola]TDN88031.1 heat shock protein Hsp20 [Herminiimonas fonticola]